MYIPVHSHYYRIPKIRREERTIVTNTTIFKHSFNEEITETIYQFFNDLNLSKKIK